MLRVLARAVLTVCLALGMLLVVALTGAPVKHLAEVRIRQVWLIAYQPRHAVVA